LSLSERRIKAWCMTRVSRSAPGGRAAQVRPGALLAGDGVSRAAEQAGNDDGGQRALAPSLAG
jgi:hypothetical protein